MKSSSLFIVIFPIFSIIEYVSANGQEEYAAKCLELVIKDAMKMENLVVYRFISSIFEHCKRKMGNEEFVQAILATCTTPEGIRLLSSEFNLNLNKNDVQQILKARVDMETEESRVRHLVEGETDHSHVLVQNTLRQQSTIKNNINEVCKYLTPTDMETKGNYAKLFMISGGDALAKHKVTQADLAVYAKFANRLYFDLYHMCKQVSEYESSWYMSNIQKACRAIN